MASGRDLRVSLAEKTADLAASEAHSESVLAGLFLLFSGRNLFEVLSGSE